MDRRKFFKFIGMGAAAPIAAKAAEALQDVHLPTEAITPEVEEVMLTSNEGPYSTTSGQSDQWVTYSYSATFYPPPKLLGK